ncbi:MAG: hypothetical protein ACHQ6T_16710 [Myxococcota bacterium]
MRWTLATFALALALGCSGGAETPEDRVRQVLAALAAAAEARDVGALKAYVSESYKDAEGNDRRTVLGVATAHFMRNSSVYVLMRVSELEIPEPGYASARALVALAGTPIANAGALLSVRADLYRFDLRLRDERGEWRVTSAAWQPASPSDFQ